MEMVKKNQVLETKKHWQMKGAFDGHCNILDTGKEKLSELDGRSIETSQTEMQKWTTKKPRIFKNCGTIWKDVTHMYLE